VEVPAEGKVTFPYVSLDEAIRENFSRIGGPQEAFRLLSKGYKTLEWRRRVERTAQKEE